jgi:hypothetical protein
MTAMLDAWFAAYAEELNAGDRPAILGRYHPDGAWMVRRGLPQLLNFTALEERYLGSAWQPPAHFAWRNLIIEQAGSDSALAIGQFLWERASGQQEIISYTGLLLQVAGAWRIRLEDENLAEILREAS